MLNLRQRRKLGVTFRNVRGALRGMDLENKSSAELSIEVLEQVVEQNPSAWKDPEIDWGSIDWDRLLAFIEKLVALIIKLFL